MSNNNSDIIISQESESLSGIKHYQYYVDKNNTPQEQWSWIDLGANVKTVKNSNDIECNNIYFRAVNNAGTYGEISSALFIERIPSSSGVTARCTASGLRPE